MRDGSTIWIVRSRGGILLSDIQEMAESFRKSVSPDEKKRVRNYNNNLKLNVLIRMLLVWRTCILVLSDRNDAGANNLLHRKSPTAFIIFKLDTAL